LIRISEAYGIVAKEAASRVLQGESISLSEAAYRITAEDIRSPIDLPPFDKSAMDGYAIPEGEFLDEYIVDDIVAAGSYYEKTVEAGHCIKVMTGAPVPDGTARVVMWEHTGESDGRVRIKRKSDKSNICRRGEDLVKGQIICPRGTILSPLALANISLGGVEHVTVAKRPTAAVFSTGDELIPAGTPIEPGKIYDSNGPMISALLKDMGIPVAFTDHLPDKLDESIDGLKRGLAEADMVILTGAVSKGDYDYLPDAFRECGLEIHFDEIAVKPGKPTTFATSTNKMVFGLPGNPVSSFLGFHLFVRPALYMMQGYMNHPRVIQCKVGKDINSRKNERDQFIPVKIDEHGAALPIDYHGSGHLTALADADGFLEIGSGITEIKAGDTAPFMPFMMRAYFGSDV